jgi:hypothetical protein
MAANVPTPYGMSSRPGPSGAANVSRVGLSPESRDVLHYGPEDLFRPLRPPPPRPVLETARAAEQRTPASAPQRKPAANLRGSARASCR